MKLDRLTVLPMVLALALSTLAANEAQAQTADVSGAWTLSVDVQGGVTTPSVTLEQDGETLTGHYSSETLGEADVTGTVSGSNVSFTFEASLQGQVLPVFYDLTLGDDGTLTGTIDLGGQIGGDVTGTRSDG